MYWICVSFPFNSKLNYTAALHCLTQGENSLHCCAVPWKKPQGEKSFTSKYNKTYNAVFLKKKTNYTLATSRMRVLHAEENTFARDFIKM